MQRYAKNINKKEKCKKKLIKKKNTPVRDKRTCAGKIQKFPEIHAQV
jgi:hypothetical protein